MFKNILITFSLLVFALNTSKACHGLPLVGYNVNVGATGVTVTANSNPATCGCGPYWLQTEISCSPTFVGQTMPNCLLSTLQTWTSTSTTHLNYPYYNSLLNVPGHNAASGWMDNCTTEPYHPVVIPFSNLCPGKVYYIRSREVVAGSFGTLGPWSAVNSFTVPGTAITPPPNSLNLSLTANPTPVICCGNVVLTAVITGTNWGQCLGNVPSCERNMTVTPTFSWTSNLPVTTGAGTSTTFTTSVNTLTVLNLSTTTTFSLWISYLCTGPSGSFTYTPPSAVPIIFPMSSISSSNIATPFTTAPASAIWTQALNQCLTAGPCICSSNQPAVITVPVINIPPTINPTVTANTCLSNPSFTFTELAPTPSNFNVTWNFGDGSPVATGTNVTHNYSASGVYTVTVTKSSCGPCTASSSFTIQVLPAPSISPSVNSPVCIGGTANFNASNISIATYSWSGPSSFISNNSNPSINNIGTINSGIYTVAVTGTNGCVSSNTIQLSTYQANINANANTTVCVGNVINLTASGTGSFYWTGPNSFSSSSQNPTLTANNGSGGVYLVTATLTGGCLASASTSITMASTNVTASHNGPACAGSNFTLIANGPGTYVWSGPGGFSSSAQNPVITNPTANAGGIYTVTATNSLGCVATATTLITIPSSKILYPSGSGIICEGGSLNFETKEGGTLYSWNGPNGFYSSNANTVLQDAQLAHTGTYTITIKDMNGCEAKGTLTVIVNPIPKIEVDYSKAKSACAPVCDMEFALKNSSQIADIKWTFGNGKESIDLNPKNICFNKGGNYPINVKVTGKNGCVATHNNSIEIFNTPTADFSYSTLNSWVNGEVKFSDASTGATINNWDWNFHNAANYQTQQVNYTYQDSGSYNVSLTVMSINGCKSSVTKKIVIEDENLIYVPNAFTPNGDGSNDVFMAVSRSQIKFEMQIFNRGGQLIFQSSDINKGWDGTFKGQLAENNVYVYKITYITKNSKAKTITGSVTLVR
ncbi:MAG: gliding motility-associated C-terminal domain-containing protein [Bacteroidetes bacterium]|nr:gliding motility-associated C-terminal domain-containing protein [Bacteroidota bacterium]MCA6444459.1 gliding motility-associated C-terminal domain-containing protein [Bacteroidota bacterium]